MIANSQKAIFTSPEIAGLIAGKLQQANPDKKYHVVKLTAGWQVAPVTILPAFTPKPMPPNVPDLPVVGTKQLLAQKAPKLKKAVDVFNATASAGAFPYTLEGGHGPDSTTLASATATWGDVEEGIDYAAKNLKLGIGVGVPVQTVLDGIASSIQDGVGDVVLHGTPVPAHAFKKASFSKAVLENPVDPKQQFVGEDYKSLKGFESPGVEMFRAFYKFNSAKWIELMNPMGPGLKRYVYKPDLVAYSLHAGKVMFSIPKKIAIKKGFSPD